MLNEADLGTNLRLLNQALAAFEAAGYLERQGLITSNLGFAYRSLGLHRRARRLYVKAGTIFRATGLVDRDDIALELATVEMEMGHLEAARTYLAEAATAASAVPNNQFLHFYMPMMFGRLATLEGDSPTALKHYKRALKLLRNVEQPAFEMNALARLAQVHLAMGSPGPALAATRRATTMHRALDLAPLQVLNAPLVWWRHSQALHASGQAASAREALEMAYRFLQNGISGLSDEGLRRNYLNKSRERREIIAAFQANGQPLEALTQEYVRVAAALTELRHA
jgi:tetratricopeptide (TPR) repeat protein